MQVLRDLRPHNGLIWYTKLVPVRRKALRRKLRKLDFS